MTPLRKFILICIIGLSVWILWILLLQRAQIHKMPNNSYEASQMSAPQAQQLIQDNSVGALGSLGTLVKMEGFSADTDMTMSNGQINELKLKTSSSTSPGIKSYSVADSGNMLLREYCIKASYNSACTGSYVNIDMVKYVLSRGCRFLDFELYHIDTTTPNLVDTIGNSRQPCVAFSNDPTGLTLKSKNYLHLSHVFQRIREYAFQAPTPNVNDPLFIQLRIYSQEKDMYQETADLIMRYFSMNRYTQDVDASKTKMADIMKSVIFVLDKNVANFDSYKNTDLPKYINIYSGGTTLMKYSPKGLSEMLINMNQVIDGTRLSTVRGYTMVEPTKVVDYVPSIYQWFNWLGTGGTGGREGEGGLQGLSLPFFVRNYGAQIVEYPFYRLGDALDNYEQFFADMGAAFVPMHRALPYIHQNPRGIINLAV